MNHRIRQFLMIVVAVFAISGAAALTAEGDQPKVAVVVAGQAAEQPSVVARARDIAADRGAQLRVTHTTADELGVTHLLAASGYDQVITVGVDRRVAITPVAARYPETRFVELSASALK
jgi:basic membrane lipoprotein Med (substrate-binding protein (PBP1-ABC) superfamily)